MKQTPAVLEGMKKHPEDNKEYKAVGLNRTLLENYPCAKQPQHAR
jgi:hypothetical protein